MTFTNTVMKLVHFTLLLHLSLLCRIDQNFNSWDLKMHRFWQFFMRFFGIHLIFFSVLDNLFYGFAVSNRPQCSPLCSFLHPLWKTFLIRENNSSWLNKYVRRLLTVMLSIGNNRFLGVKRLGKPLEKGPEYFNSPAGKQREILDCHLTKKIQKAFA